MKFNWDAKDATFLARPMTRSTIPWGAWLPAMFFQSKGPGMGFDIRMHQEKLDLKQKTYGSFLWRAIGGFWSQFVYDLFGSLIMFWQQRCSNGR